MITPLVLLAMIAFASSLLIEDSRADLENQVFTSREEGLRLVIPRGWRATDQPSYPGFLLWLLRSEPEGTMVLTAEALTHERYCTWPVACRTSPDSLATKYACMLRSKLGAQRLNVGPVQAGPKDNEAAGLPSVWFEYDDGKKFLRHAVALTDTRTITLVLSAPSNDARANHIRSFEQALRTLRRVSGSTATTDAGVTDGTTSAAAPFDPAAPCSSIPTQQ